MRAKERVTVSAISPKRPPVYNRFGVGMVLMYSFTDYAACSSMSIRRRSVQSKSTILLIRSSIRQNARNATDDSAVTS